MAVIIINSNRQCVWSLQRTVLSEYNDMDFFLSTTDGIMCDINGYSISSVSHSVMF